ncbi:MAG: glycosyltransferase family 2 protein [Vicingus serpentipes]|nr:glycosyltransferase family 2 protein [Vicingus serpentipes]
MNKVAVVILNWNGKTHLKQFLPSVIQYSNNAEIIVIDNCSDDDSIAYLTTNFPTVKIISLDKNYGFAGGYNKGLQQVDAPYYVLLNSDVEVTEKWLDPMIQLLENDSKIAACQPKIKDYTNKNYFEYAGAAGGFIDKLGYPFCKGRVFEELEEDNGQYDQSDEIFWASGACLFIRSEIYRDIGGLDDFFFAHMEEIDLCWRIKNQGYKIMTCPSSIVYHLGGGTLHKINPKKTFLNYRNSLLTLHKNLPKEKIFYTIVTRLFLDALSGIKLLLEGKAKHTLAIIKAHFSFYAAIKQNKQKRKPPKNPNLTGKIGKIIIFNYFFKKEKTFSSILK